MVCWESVAIGYASYLAAVAWTIPRFRKARLATLGAAAGAWLFLPLVSATAGAMPDAVRALTPAPVLLAGYWLSGVFYVAPMPRLEGLLLRVDDACLPVLSRLIPVGGVIDRYLELSYLLVYAVVPAGAIALLFAGRASEIERFWSTVMLAAFASYGALPWLQTRPPRMLEHAETHRQPRLRRLNLWVLGRGSIQANTIPSGHAATATAVALVVGSAVPEARAALLVIASSIVLATVVGRYHFVVDSVAGTVVGFIAWAVG